MTGKRKRTDLTESMKVIFGEEIGGLSSDGFEGSDGEYRIFASVFYGNAVEKGNFVSASNFNGFGPIGTGSGRSQMLKSMNVLSPVNCEHSTITSHSSVKILSREDSFTVNGNSPEMPKAKSHLLPVSSCAHECSSSQLEPGSCCPNIKRIKSSHDGSSDHDKKDSGSCLADTTIGKVLVQFEPSKETAPCSLELDSNHSGQLITIPIVESSVHSIILHHYPLKEIMSHPKLLCSSEASNVNAASPDGRDAKKVVQDKVITSPVSQESSVSKLLVTDLPITVGEKPGAPLCLVETARPRCRESLFLSSDSVRSTWKLSYIAELRQRLRWHMRHFLALAGWKIETRRRRNRPYDDSVYLAPGCRRTIYASLPKAWEYCGKSLLANRTYLLQEENKREWVDVIEFWSDLSDTLVHIEKEVQQIRNSISFNDWFALLDPFVTMVFCGGLGRLKEKKATGGVSDYSTVKASFSSKHKKSILGSKFHENEKKDLVLVAENIESFGNVSGSLDGNVEPTHQSNNACAQLQVLHAEINACPPLVGESIPEMVGSITACKKEGAHGSFSKFGEVGIENGDCQLELGSGGPNETLFCDVDSEKVVRNRKTSNRGTMKSPPNRQLISPRGDKALVEMLNSMSPNSIGNDFCDVRDMGCMERNLSKSRSKRITRSLTRGSFIGRVSSFYSHLEGFVKNNFAQNLTTPNLEASISKKSDVSSVETSTSQNLKLADRISFDETVDCMVEEEAKSIDLNLEINGVFMHEGVNETKQERNLGSQHVAKLLRRDQLVGEWATEQQSPFLPHREEQCKEGVPPSGREKVLAHGNISGTNNAIHVQQELASSGHRRSPRNVVINFHVDDKAKDNQECLLHRDLPNLSQREMLSDVGGANKTHKKSKKLSVIEVCKPFDQCNKHNLSAPQRVEEKNSDSVNLDRIQENLTCNQSKEGVKCHADIGKKESPKMVCAVHSSQCEYEGKSNEKKSWGGSRVFREPVVVADEGKNAVGPKGAENTVEAPLVCVNDESPITKTRKKAVKAKKCKKQDENGRKRLKAYKCQIDDDELLIAAIIKNKGISSKSKCSKLQARNPLSKSAKKVKNQKGGCRLLPRGSGKGGKHDTDVDWSSPGTRTVLSWLIDSGELFQNEIVQYRSTKDDSTIKDGWVTRDGLLCKCCNEILSISEFKAHAGSKLSRPSLNLFLERGKSFTLCQLQAWSTEYKTRKGGKQIVEVDQVDLNDDTCGLCGDGGDLICCDNCPSTFHQACLTSQELPEGSWYCPYCICGICGDVVSDKEVSGSLAVLTCFQCEHKYHKTCVEEKGAYEGRAVSETWFCGQNCREVYSGLRSRVGVSNHIGDGFSWTLLRCMHGDQKVPSAQRFALMAECNTKLAVALTIMEECFLPMVDPRTGIDMIPHVLYNWRSNFARLNYQGFYTVVLEKGDKIISVASIRIHGVTVAEMPLIATCSENRRQGMCRRLMNAIEELLASYKVERLVISAIPALVDTWTFGFGYKPMEDEEREKFSKINFMVFPGTTLLEKRLYGSESVECVQTGAVEVDLNQAVGENSINITAVKASTEVLSEDLVENRKGENLCQFVGQEIGDLPLNPAMVKQAETVDLISSSVTESDLSCILDRKDLNTLMGDLNLGPKTDSEVGNESNNRKCSSARDSKEVPSEENRSAEYAVAKTFNAQDQCCSLDSVTVAPTALFEPQGLPSSSKTVVEAVQATRDVVKDGNFDQLNVLEGEIHDYS